MFRSVRHRRLSTAATPRRGRQAIASVVVLAVAATIAGVAGPAAAETGAMVYPVGGKVPKGGMPGDPRTGRPEGHVGLDISGNRGQTVVAAAAGSVANIAFEGPRGWTVRVNHSHGYSTIYQHLQANSWGSLKRGQAIGQGTALGRVGNTGTSGSCQVNCYGYHLHFEILRSGTAVTNWAGQGPGKAGLAHGSSVTAGSPIQWSFPGLPAGSAPKDFTRNDFTGDGNVDLIARKTNGTLHLYPGNGSGKFLTAKEIGRGWSDFNAIVAPGDFDGDGKADIIGRKSDSTLHLYPGNGSGGFGTPRQIGHGWHGIDVILAPGDFDGDGKPDLIARKTDSTLHLYPGNGSGGFGTPRQIGHGWNGIDVILAPGDFDGDGNADLIARKTDGTLHLYPGNGSGNFRTAKQIGHGWNQFNWIM